MDTFDTFHPRVFSKRIYWIHSSITLACSPRGYVRYAQKSLRSTLVRLDVLLKDTFNTFKLVVYLMLHVVLPQLARQRGMTAVDGTPYESEN